MVKAAMNEAATARMNATVSTTEIHLRTECREFNEEWYENTLFQETFFREPCRGCGSNHSILREIGRLECGTPLYEYRCNVIEPSPLYIDNNVRRLKVQFRLGTSNFALDCGYNLDHALARLEFLRGGGSGSGDMPSIFDSFINEVRRLCVEEEVRRIRG